MTIQEAIELIGKPIYVYEIYHNRISNGYDYEIYEDRIDMVGKDFVYNNNKSLLEKGRKHYFEDFDMSWFIDREKCKIMAENEVYTKNEQRNCKMTNRQWLESFSDEEFYDTLKEHFSDDEDCILCAYINTDHCVWELGCKAGFIKWLKEEHKDEE